jgi:hypothetical protein
MPGGWRRGGARDDDRDLPGEVHRHAQAHGPAHPARGHGRVEPGNRLTKVHVGTAYGRAWIDEIAASEGVESRKDTMLPAFLRERC